MKVHSEDDKWEGVARECRQLGEETKWPRIDWRTVGIWVMLGLMGALLILALNGCTPAGHTERGLNVDWPRPEASLEGLPVATGKVTDETNKVTTSAGTIKKVVADSVKDVREAAKVAPVPAANIAKGHEVIYAAATDAEAAALEAREQVRVVEQAVTAADTALVALREAHQREVKALGQQVEQLEQDNKKLQEAARSESLRIARIGQWAGGGLLALAVGLLFLGLKTGNLMPAIIVGAIGGTLLGLSALLQWITPYLPWLALAAFGGLVIYMAVKHRQKAAEAALNKETAKAGVLYADAIKAEVREAVKTDGTAATHVAEALKKVKNEAILNQPEEVQREVWNLRPFKQG